MTKSPIKPPAKSPGKPSAKRRAAKPSSKGTKPSVVQEDATFSDVTDDEAAGFDTAVFDDADDNAAGERIAKLLARVGLCSRRDAERWIAEGRVSMNGTLLTTPAINVSARDRILVDGKPLPQKERTRLWLYHKPRGLVTTARDPEGRPTVFDSLPEGLPRVIAVGRLDINTEGLLLLTNDGGLARALELPATGWLRRYRVRAWGEVLQPDLDRLKDGIEVDGVMYGAIEGTLDRIQGANVWATIGLREGKNREVKNVLSAIGLDVNRLIRISYGPFQLGELPEGQVVEIRGRVLRDQLGPKLVREAGLDFDAPLREEAGERQAQTRPTETKPGAKTAEPKERESNRAFSPSKRSARPVTGRNRDEDRLRRPRTDRPSRGDKIDKNGEADGPTPRRRGSVDRVEITGGRPPRPTNRNRQPDGEKERPDGRPSGGRRASRVAGANPEDSRPQGSKPQGSKPQGSKPQGSRPQGSKSLGAKTLGSKASGSRRSGSDAPDSRPPGSNAPGGKRPGPKRDGGGRPSGERPSGRNGGRDHADRRR